MFAEETLITKYSNNKHPFDILLQKGVGNMETFIFMGIIVVCATVLFCVVRGYLLIVDIHRVLVKDKKQSVLEEYLQQRDS